MTHRSHCFKWQYVFRADEQNPDKLTICEGRLYHSHCYTSLCDYMLFSRVQKPILANKSHIFSQVANLLDYHFFAFGFGSSRNQRLNDRLLRWGFHFTVLTVTIFVKENLSHFLKHLGRKASYFQPATIDLYWLKLELSLAVSISCS